MSLELACTFVACDCNFKFGGHTYKKIANIPPLNCYIAP